MSKTEDEILSAASITMCSTNKITDTNKITQVILASKIRGKELTTAALKKLIRRCDHPLTDEQIEELVVKSELAYTELKKLKRDERLERIKSTDESDIPEYIIEVKDSDGQETGKYILDYIRYTDALYKSMNIYNLKGTLFVYDPSTNTYKENINEIETNTRDIFKKYSICGKLSDIEREVSAHITSMGSVRDYPFVGRYGTIHVKNGSLDLTTGDITEPTSEHMYDYRIETEYKKFPGGTPELDEFLSVYGINEPIDILAKVIWQRAFHDTLKELTVLVGPKDCGKTTLVEFVQATLDGNMSGKNNVSRTLLHDILQRFGFASLEGKLMNFGDDLPDMFVKNSSRINEMVGSVNRNIEKKGRDGYDAVITAYYVFTTNNLPPLDDDDNAIWGKIRVVNVNKQLDIPAKPRSELFTQLICEQLLYRAVEKAKGYAKTPYVKEQSVSEVRRLWHESTLDVEAFLREATKHDESMFVSLESIREHYDHWCDLNKKIKHVKYLAKKLQPFLIRRSMSNGYCIRLLQLQQTQNSQNKIQETLA